jgi:hypothetical protein
VLPGRRRILLPQCRSSSRARAPTRTLHDRRCHSDRTDENHEADREQPQQVEPPIPTDTHAWGNAVHLGNRAGESGGVDDVLARCQLPAITADDVRRDTRALTSRRTSRGGIRAGSHAVNPTPQAVVRWPTAAYPSVHGAHGRKDDMSHCPADLASCPPGREIRAPAGAQHMHSAARPRCCRGGRKPRGSRQPEHAGGANASAAGDEGRASSSRSLQPPYGANFPLPWGARPGATRRPTPYP